jgi:superfamily II DNA or RNA helicase
MPTYAARVDTLHSYQWEAVADLSQYVAEGERRLALIMPQGAGKSLTIACLLQKMRSYRCAVVATPLLTIESGFLGITHRVEAHLPEELGSASTVQYDFKDFWYGVGVGDTPTRADRDAFEAHLSASKPAHFALVTTHQALRCWKDSLPKNLHGTVLVLDEAHHADADSETLLGQMADDWYAAGGCVIYITATPCRDNGISTLPDGTCAHKRSIAKHSLWLAMSFKVERVGVEVKARDIREVSGKALPKASEKLANALVDRWEADGRPKSVFIVPPDASRGWSTYLKDRIQVSSPTTRIHDAVGLGVRQQKSLDLLLKRERKVSDYADSEVDLVLACRRFDEGTDWPLCSHVYNVGLPTNYSLVLQRWGRAFRDKRGIKGYPERFKQCATITFVTLRASVETMQEFERKSHNTAMLLACFMEDHEIAKHFVSVGEEARPRKVQAVRDEQKWVLDDATRARAAQTLLAFDTTFKERHGRAPRVGEQAKYIKSLTDVNMVKALMVLLAERVAMKRKVKDPSHLFRDRLPQPDVSSFFEAIASEYRDLTLSTFDNAIRTYTQMTGETARQIVLRLGIQTDQFFVRDLTEQETLEFDSAPTSPVTQSYQAPVEVRPGVFLWNGRFHIKRGERMMEVGVARP